MIRLGFLASGRGSNFEALVGACRDGRLKAEPRLLLVDQPQAGALEVADRLGVPARLVATTEHPGRAEHERALAAHLQKERIDLLLLAGYRRLLSPFLIGLMYESRLGQSRILNIHPADTREYQGLHGYRWALQEGKSSTAVTVHFVDEGMDTGQIVLQAPLPIEPGDDLDSLQRRGLALEHRLYAEAAQKVVLQLENLCAVF